MSSIEEDVRRRAYELWENAGQPEGRSHEFWFAAIAELEGKPPGEEVEPPGPPIAEQTVDDEALETFAPKQAFRYVSAARTP